MTVVAITGRKGSGKDTAAKALIEHGFVPMKFADLLKDMLRLLLETQGVDKITVERMIEGDLKEVETPYLQYRTPRFAMQTLGTEWGREIIGDGLWADALANRAKQYENVVITDMRFPNEFKTASDDLKAITVRVERPGNENNEFSNHPSEQYIDTLPVDHVIVNDAGIPELQSALLRIAFFK